MDCPSENPNGAEILLAYSARGLDPALAALFEAHLAACPACRAFVAAQSELWSALDSWTPEPVSPSFTRDLYARIEAEQRRPWWLRLLLPRGSAAQGAWFRPALSAALVCSMALGILLLPGFDGLRNQSPRESDEARIERVDVEQVEQELEDIEMLRKLSPSQYPREDDGRSDTSRL